MSSITLVARFSLLEHRRRKLLAFFFGASILVTAALLYLVGSEAEPLLSSITGVGGLAAFLSLGFLQFFALIATLAVSMGNIGRPFSNGEVALFLARPVTRSQYALGRFGASVLVVAGMCLLLAVETQLVSTVSGGEGSLLLWKHWMVAAFNLVVIAAVTTVISALINAPILVAILGYFASQVIGGIAAVRLIARVAEIGGFLKGLIDFLWYVTPKFLPSPLERAMPGAAEFMPPAGWGVTAWAVGYLILLIAGAAALTSRKDA